MVRKKRRNDRGKGCIEDLKGDFSNVKMKEYEIEDIYTMKSERGAEKEPQESARIVAGM